MDTGVAATARSKPFSFEPGVLPVQVGEPACARLRSRLWELNNAIHCSIIGTCLTPAELRRVMGKVAQADTSHASDHDLHAQAVSLCGQHNTCSKLLQKALDRRHQATVKQFARLHDEAAVMAKWREARQTGDIPGAYWATLTHPAIGHAGVRDAFGDVHMLSHLVGAANRADIRRLAALEAENAALLAKVERQQARLQTAITGRDATIRRLTALAASAPPAAPPADDDAAVALRHLVDDLQGRLAREASRGERLEHRVAETAVQREAAEARADAAEALGRTLQRELTLVEGLGGTPADTAIKLPAECVLYVGGRPGCVEQIRAMLEAAGGGLLSHDGGRHDHPSLLAGLVGRADRVVFPVDCVSHDAALAVKRLCRQLGKPWAPLRSSGVASFLAAARSGEEQVERVS